MATLKLDGPIYQAFIADKQYAHESLQCIRNVVEKLLRTTTTADRPGMLLGKVQSGKTRTFLGILALAFDNGYDFAVVFTKGTKALAQQTIERLKREFEGLIETDKIEVFDIMHLPSNLTPYELQKKLILVCKKEDDNIRRLNDAIFETYSDLAESHCLIIDDEADFASIGFRRSKEEGIKINKIAGQIDNLRKNLGGSSFLQVTATPYSLYLQPDELKIDGSSDVFMPTRPAFTELVPVHDEYIGGKYYFEESQEHDSIASFLHHEVAPAELRILKKPDGRTFKMTEVMTSSAIESLRSSIITFIVGGSLRRLQDEKAGKIPGKFSFIVHTERSREAHSWQEKIVRTLVEKLIDLTTSDPNFLRQLIRASYDDLSRSIRLMGFDLPSFEETEKSICFLLQTVMITRVNSENDISQLLDERTDQLRLRTPLNIFIGGQILDRGLTIANLIGFYYGRTANRFQQDTVLQHSRMYGLRSLEDLTVTRFYTTAGIYEVLNKINEFDDALRKAFEIGGHEAGVVFLRKDDANRIVPCSPNKILLSSTTTLRPRKRLLPIGFQTKSKSQTTPSVQRIDRILDENKDSVSKVLSST